MIENVIFDMNGVITDDEDLHELATQKVFGNYGFTITPKLYRQYCLGRTDTSAFTDLISDFQLNDIEVAFIISEKSMVYQKLIADNIKVYPGVMMLIERLYSKYTLAITTSSTFEEVKTVINQLYLENRFEMVVSANDVKRGKPDPEPYALTAERLGALPENCVVIEDSENGIRSAIAAGMKCIAITNTENRDKLTLAHYIIEDYSEITDELLERL